MATNEADRSASEGAGYERELARMLVADDYTLRHLATHLHAAGRRDRLYRLLLSNPAWMEAKFRRLGDDTAYAADLALAIGDYADPVDAAGLVPLVQLQSARQVLHGRATLYMDTDLRTLVWLGREGEALGSVRLRSEPARVVDGLLAVYDALRQRGQAPLALLGEALATAREVDDAEEHAWALINLAGALIEVHDHRAEEVLAEAEVAARRIEEEWRGDKALGELLWLTLQQGRYEDVLALTRKKKKKKKNRWPMPDEIRDELMGYLIQEGRTDEAEVVASGFSRDELRAEALSWLAVALAEAGQGRPEALLDKAIRLARKINYDESRLEKVEEVTRAAVEAGCLEAAMRIVRSAKDEWEQVRLWPLVVLAVAQSGDPTAPDLFDEAIRRARHTENADARIALLRELALALSQAGDGRAGDLADEALAALRSGSRWSPAASDLLSMALVLHQIDDEQAATLFDEALAVARAQKTGRQRAAQLKDVALAMLEAEIAGAARALDEAREAAAGIRYREDRRDALDGLIRALVKAGLLREAEELACSIPAEGIELDLARSELAVALVTEGRGKEGLQVAHGIQSERSSLKALRKISLLLARAGDPRAEIAFAEIPELARSDQERQTEWRAAHAIGRVLARAGDPRAEIPFSQAEQAARAAGSIERLGQAAAAMTRAGYSRAEDLFAEARALADAVRYDEPRGRALRALVETLLEAERWREAEQTAQAIPLEDSFVDEGIYVPADEARAEALQAVAAAMARAGKFPGARRVARSIRNSRWRTMALADVTEAMARAGDPGAEKMLAEVRRSTEYFEEDDWIARQLKIELARALTATGHLREAEVIGSSFGSGFYAGTGGAIHQNAAVAMARAGRMEEAEALARTIQDEGYRLRALRELTAMRASALVAERSYDEALAMIRAIQDRRLRELALDDLADMLVADGRFAQALATLRPLKLDEFVQWLAESALTLEAQQSGLSVAVVEAMLAVAGWTRETWRALHADLAAAP